MILDFTPPKKILSSDEHNKQYMSDCGVRGTYVSNMSEEDMNRWKAKHINKGKPDARIELRKTFNGAELLIIVALDGWNYKNETIEGDKYGHYKTKGLNVRMSTNGPLMMTFSEFYDIEMVVNEAGDILKGT